MMGYLDPELLTFSEQEVDEYELSVATVLGNQW